MVPKSACEGIPGLWRLRRSHGAPARYQHDTHLARPVAPCGRAQPGATLLCRAQQHPTLPKGLCASRLDRKRRRAVASEIFLVLALQFATPAQRRHDVERRVARHTQTIRAVPLSDTASLADVEFRASPLVHISVVSHGHASLMLRLLESATRYLRAEQIRLSLTMNIEQPLPFDAGALPFPVRLLHNRRPLGFGANHNQAFRSWTEERRPDFFCVLNPDVEFVCDPFGALIEDFDRDPELAVAAPRVVNECGVDEDSARKLPTPLGLLAKALLGARGTYRFPQSRVYETDWIAGMFMMFRSDLFERVGGFDERYFLYYEDVDICCRVRLLGYHCVADAGVSVVHMAQRASRRSPQHLKWHIASMVRFLASDNYRKCRALQR